MTILGGVLFWEVIAGPRREGMGARTGILGVKCVSCLPAPTDGVKVWMDFGGLVCHHFFLGVLWVCIPTASILSVGGLSPHGIGRSSD